MNARRTAALSVAAALALALTSAPAGATGTSPGPAPRLAPPASSTSAAHVAGLGPVSGAAVERTPGKASVAKVDVIAHVRLSSARPGVLTAARAVGVTGGRSIPALGVQSFSVAPGDAAALVARLKATNGVDSVHIAKPLHLFDAPNDSQYSTQAATYLDTVNASGGWDVTHGSSSVVVAVIDTGVRATHEDLAGKVLPGWNVLTSTTDVTDTMGHGTFVSGVAAAATNNSLGIAGVGWNTSVLPVKVSDSDTIMLSDAAAGIIWAADHGADVINCSFGGDADATLQSAITYAQGKGVLVVAAAGNEGGTTNPVSYPAAYAGVMAVGATTATGHAAGFSQHGSWLTVAAPGVSIWSLDYSSDTTYASGDGTSFASPIVAGEAALLKAKFPTASAADLRAAIVASATPLPGEGMGAGRINIAAAFSHLPPTSVPTITTPTDGATVSGASVPLSATSTAPKVQFAIGKTGDGPHVIGTPVAVASGTASTTWSSFGYDGGWTLYAYDCSAAGDCATSAASVGVTVANTTPVVTSPASGGTVSGSYVLGATAAGGGIRWLIDGTSIAFDGSAPYSVVVAASLADGSHSVVAVQCDATGARCDGPTSTAVPFTSTSLHPSVTAAGPSPFSPNGDKRRDTATTTYRLERASTVRYTVVNGAGAAMFASRPLGTLAAGLHSVVITGRTAGGTPWPDGTYSVQILTSAVVGNVTLRGAASRSVRIDDHPPSMSAASVPAATFYPVKDGYRDYFSPSAVPSEAGSLSLVITSAKGAAVRTIAVPVLGGKAYAIAWNGRNNRGVPVAAGRYVWRLLAQDVAGNRRFGIARSEYISLKHLVIKSATVSVAGGTASDWGATNGLTCAGRTSAASSFSGGLHLLNMCDQNIDGQGSAYAYYSIKVPAAVSYKDLTVRSVGKSSYLPSFVSARVYSTASAGWPDYMPNYWQVNIPTAATLTFGTIPASGRVSPSGRVALELLLPDYLGGTPNYDWDIKNVSVTIGYRVLG